MNDTLDIIAQRYSCRDFSDKKICDGDLSLIAAAGNMAPTGMNRKCYQIIMLSNKELMTELEAEGLSAISRLPDKSAYERIKSRGGRMFYNAAAIALIPIKQSGDRGMELIDLGIVAQNIALAATSLGIGSCHCGMTSFCFSPLKEQELKSKLRIAEGYSCGFGVLLGYEKQRGTPHTPDESKITFIG